jgi:hypothetical protein
MWTLAMFTALTIVYAWAAVKPIVAGTKLALECNEQAAPLTCAWIRRN